jgi:hypothetical protein
MEGSADAMTPTLSVSFPLSRLAGVVIRKARVPHSPLLSPAYSAPASTTRSVGRVLRGELVPVEAVRLAGIQSCKGDRASQRVLSRRHGLKVRRVDARRHTTQVVKFQAIRNRPDEQFVGNTVSPHPHATPQKPPVPGMLRCSQPDPTGALELLNASPKADFKRASPRSLDRPRVRLGSGAGRDHLLAPILHQPVV